MTQEWTLIPLQRKREWELERARGRLATLLRSGEQTASVLHMLEGDRADQEAAALAAARRQVDPMAQGQALAYLAGVEARLRRARAVGEQLEVEAALAREACNRCRQNLEILATLHERHLGRRTYAAQRDAAKEADFAWTARAAGSESR